MDRQHHKRTSTYGKERERLEMAIHYLDIYRSPNIGVFVKANDKYILVPRGLAQTKVVKLADFLETSPVRISIGGSRLIGPLVALNCNGVLVSRLAEDEEIRVIKDETRLRVERLPSKYTSVGNLVVANDKGALVSTIFPKPVIDSIIDTLDVPIESMSIASYGQIGSLIVATNVGAVVHPHASEDEMRTIGDVLKVDVHPATVNGGVPFVSSGLVVNSKNAVVGSLTSGPELLILSRAFKL